MSRTVRLESGDRRGELILERPPLNVLDRETLERLDEVLAGVAADPPQLLVLRSALPRAFSAGVAVEDHLPEAVAGTLAVFHRALGRLRSLPSVSLAVIRGHCLGGGLELAATCDLRLAATGSVFGQPEIDVGCFPPAAAVLLPRLVGRDPALELMLSGRRVEAREAKALGLVTWVAEAGALEERLEEIAGGCLAKSAAACRALKEAVTAAEGRPFLQALEASEEVYLERTATSHDAREGAMAFLEKRTPVWRHR